MSDIDPDVFVDGVRVDKADLREQLEIAKNEITALQNTNMPARKMAFADDPFLEDEFANALLRSNNLSDLQSSQEAAQIAQFGYVVEDLAALKALTSRPESVVVKTGQAAGVWQWVLGSSTTADDALVVECTSGTAGRYKRVYDGEIHAAWFGVDPSATAAVNYAAMTAAVTAANSTGKEILVATPGTITFAEPVVANTSVRIRHAPGVVIKLDEDATPLALGKDYLAAYILRAGDSSIIGGTIDANRAAQNKTAYNTAGGSAGQGWGGVLVLGADGTPIDNIEIRTRIINAMEWMLDVKYASNVTVDITGGSSGCGVRFDEVSIINVVRIDINDLDNDGAKVYPHAIDFFNCDTIRGGNIKVIDQAGYDTVSGGGSLSDWFSGITFVDTDTVDLTGVIYKSLDDNDMTKSVGLSLLSVTNARLRGVDGVGYTSVNCELGGCHDLHISDFDFDGRWQSSSLWPSEIGNGIHTNNGGYYGDFLSRVLAPSSRVHFERGRSRRMRGPGIIDYLNPTVTYTKVDSFGNLDGMEVRSQMITSTIPVPQILRSKSSRFIDCRFNFNERYGVLNTGGYYPVWNGCEMKNNGQSRTNATPGTLRNGDTFAGPSAGYCGQDDAQNLERTSPMLMDCLTDDDQTNVTSKGSADPTTPTEFLAWDMTLYCEGQSINLEGCGTASADLITQVVSIDKDTVTIADSIVTFPLVAGTGTISTSGTALTGVGTDLENEIKGPAYIKVGSDYRKIRTVASNGLSAVLDSAFPTSLSGVAFDIVSFNAMQQQCQDYGILTESATRDVGLAAHGHMFGAGNVLGNTSLALPAIISPARWPALPLWLPIDTFHSINGSPAITGSTGGIYKFYAMDAAATESIFTSIWVPPGAPLNINVTVKGINMGAGAGDVLLQLRSRTHVTGTTTYAASAISNDTLFTAALLNVLQDVDLGTRTITAAGQMLSIGISRAGADVSDTLANDWGIMGVRLNAV
jgi:hypothetical protein